MGKATNGIRRIALKKIAVGIVVLIADLIYASTRPDTFRIERMTKSTPRRKIFPRQWLPPWETWSPWEKSIRPSSAAIAGRQRAGAKTRGRATGDRPGAWKSSNLLHVVIKIGL
jgi:hypothetical protein